ncbi:MAG TPA: kelch repeat-containing protein, partial [Actinomycetota bacterium]|nr:kelch repeat-containing protein [Actinomycetota bacterium]
MRRPSSLLLIVALVASMLWGAPPSVGAEADPRWTDLDQRVRPPSAMDAGLAYDEARHELLLFGGAGNDGPVGTWVFRDESWTELQPDPAPTPRYGSSMVYDPVRQEIVVFGGWGAVPRPEGGNSTSNETWIWNGETWRLATPEHSPPSRAFAAAGFDRARGELILFGGITGDGTGSATMFGDTWTWNGTDWTELSPETSPPRRHSVGSAYDPVREEFMIFGGARDFSDAPAPQDPCEIRDPIGNSCVVNVPSSSGPQPSSVLAE